MNRLISILVMLCSLLPLQAALAAPGDVLFNDDFEGGFANWTSSGPGDASIGNETANSGSNSMRLRWDTVTATSTTINAAVPAAELSVWIRRGADAFSEDPDSGEDLSVEFFDGATWNTLEVFPGVDTDGEILTRTYFLPPTALHAGLQIRFQLASGSGADFDYWHVDDVVVTEATPTPPLIVGSCDTFENGLGNWTVTDSSRAGISAVTANSPTQSLFTRHGVVTATSVAVDTSAISSALIVEMWVRRGDDAFSENPEAGEDLVVEYFNNASTWVGIETFPGNGAPGEIFNRSYTLPADALHAGFRIRVRQTGGSGVDWDYWHMDDVCLSSAPEPVLDWRMEEFNWNGTAGEVVDSSGNNLNGTAINGTGTDDTTPAIGGDPGTCRYGVFDGNNDLLEIADNPLLDIANELTVTVWVNPANIPGGGLMSIISKDENFEFHIDSSGRIFWWWGGGVRELTSSGTLTPGVWQHVAIVYSASGAFQRIYINGVEDPNTNNQSASLTLNNDPFQVGGDQGFAGREFDGLLDEVRVYDIALSATQVADVMNQTHPCAPPPPVLYYAMDETLWAGAGSVVDSSGNNNDGSPLGGAAPASPASNPALVGDPGTCGYAEIPNNTNNSIDAVASSFTPGNRGSITFWYNSASNWNSNGDRMLFDASRNLGNNNADKHFFLVRQDNGGGRLVFVLEDSNDQRMRAITGGLGFAGGTWVHIAVTWDLPADFMEIYVNGASVATDNTNTNGVLGNINDLYIGDNRDTGTGGNNWSNDSANGFLDEFRIYDEVISASQVATDFALRHPCAAGIDHYDIDISPAAGITCLPVTVTITAKDSANTTVAHTSATTINLATSTGLGTWGGASVGAVSSVAPGAGTADYQFANGQSSVDIQFNYPVLGGPAPETVNINIVSTPNETTGAAIAAEDDPDVDFHTAALIFNNVTAGNNIIPTQISGKPSDVAPDAVTLNIQAVRASDNDPSVCQPIFSNGSVVSIDLGAECRNPAQCAGNQLNITNSAPATSGGVNIATSDDNGGAQTVAAYSAVDLQFGANSDATLVLNYPDAGLMQLHARYPLLLDDGSPSGEFAVGISNDFVVKPAGLCVESTDPDSDCAGADGSCSVFRKAGSGTVENAFNLTVRGVTWESAGETDTQFCSGSNVTTPNFELSNIALAHALVAPLGAGTQPGALGVTALDIVDADNGTGTVANQSLSEVGVFTVTATPPAYLGESLAASTSANIGRFIPDRFNVTMQNTPAFGDACTGFTYQDQPFYYNDTPSSEAPVLAITALNSNGATTVNYGGDFWKLSGGVLSRDYSDGSAPAPAATLSPTTSQSGNFTLGGETDFDGVGTFTLTAGSGGDTFMYQKAVPEDTPEEPFVADVDVDFAAGGFQDSDHNPPARTVCYDSDNDNSCEDFTYTGITGTELRWGRMVINNNQTSELLSLPVPLRTEYFSGGIFTTNVDDNCTTYQSAEASLSEVSPADNLAPGDTSVTGPVATTTVVNGVSTPGNHLTVGAPGAGKTGSLDLILDLGAGGSDQPWLQFDGANPSGRVTFGIFSGPENLIYIREPWNQ